MSADTREEHTGDEDEFVEGAETEILQNYSDDNWGVVGDLVDEAAPTNLEAEDTQKLIHRSLTYSDEEMFIELSRNEMQTTDIESKFMDVHAEDRNSFVPDEFGAFELDFPLPETERVDACTECNGNGRNQCSSCTGSGANQCRRCNGSGTNSDQTASCSKCGGSGTIICGSCSGNGTVSCGTCNATGESYKMDFIRRTFDDTETVEAETDRVPEKYIETAEGIHLNTERNELASDEIRNETEVREVPASILDYEYDGEEYTIYQVEDDAVARSHPQSTARKLLPVAVGAVALVVVALWYVGVI